MNGSPTREHHEVVVVGAGQAGLAAAYHLRQRDVDFVVLGAEDRVGDQWRSRYDSLRLYSPAMYDALPGMPFPLPSRAFPTGAQMADYLESYVHHHQLPVVTGTRVEQLRPADEEGGGFVLETGHGRSYRADQVVVAAGFFRDPYVPEFARDLSPGVRQMHSSEYRRPSQLAEGPVLVVGLSHSGADLAMEAAAAGHEVTLSGRGHGQLPFSVDSRIGRAAWPVLRFVAANLLTLRTPIGRKMAVEIRRNGGAPLLRYRRSDLLRAGVRLTDERTVGVQDGRPQLAGGEVLDVANVIWCTGFRPDYGWIRLPILDESGYPPNDRGVAAAVPGLYFVGLIFQSGFTSMLVVGADRDAEHVVGRLASRAAEARGRSMSATPRPVGS